MATSERRHTPILTTKAVVIVVGIDFSRTSAHLLQTARELALRASRTELHVVHAMPVQRISPGLVDALPRASRSISAEVQSAHEKLDALCAPIVAGLDALVTTHVRAGRAVDEIPRLAAEVSADVILVEAHGRTGLRRLFHHSLAADLARNAPCSVLTVRPKAATLAEVATTPG